MTTTGSLSDAGAVGKRPIGSVQDAANWMVAKVLLVITALASIAIALPRTIANGAVQYDVLYVIR